ncbi:MAG TPA: cupredoxin domain-containing protein [Candidatus Limnocylindria bacterium]|nr:cupredoxin domain-containing protein [Candidatus Limnocylindria bacterium]
MRGPGAALLASLILMTACAAPAAPVTGSGPRTITIDMSDFGYSPREISVRAGETLTLRFRNAGRIVHEFMAGRQPMAGIGYKEDWLAMAGGAHAGSHDTDHQGAGVRVEPSGSATLTITVPADAGEFEFACFVAGHYESGMKGRLVVTPSSAADTRPPAPAASGAPARPAATPTATRMPDHTTGDMGDEAH